MHAASALRSPPVFSAKARKVRAVGFFTSSMLAASSAWAMGPVPAIGRTMLPPSPPKIALRTRSGCLSARNAAMRAPIE